MLHFRWNYVITTGFLSSKGFKTLLRQYFSKPYKSTVIYAYRAVFTLHDFQYI